MAYGDGTFYIYYSAGGWEGEGHRVRVDTVTHPEGPFEDSGTVLTPDEPFAIDGHPFRDDDGRWYLYYCRDFLEPDEEGRVGTGIVVDRLVSMTRLAGERRKVLRPHAEWQLYECGRRWYGRVWDWCTVEGAPVRKRDGRYYCLCSGSAWREPNYGVSYVVADHALGPFAPGADADESPRVLRTVPDNAHEYLVYHAWDPGHTTPDAPDPSGGRLRTTVRPGSSRGRSAFDSADPGSRG